MSYRLKKIILPNDGDSILINLSSISYLTWNMNGGQMYKDGFIVSCGALYIYCFDTHKPHFIINFETQEEAFKWAEENLKE